METLATVPHIIQRGADWFSGIGTATSKGTKIFSLVGKINDSGLIEVPMGIPLREIIYDIGGYLGTVAIGGVSPDRAAARIGFQSRGQLCRRRRLCLKPHHGQTVHRLGCRQGRARLKKLEAEVASLKKSLSASQKESAAASASLKAQEEQLGRLQSDSESAARRAREVRCRHGSP